MTTFVQVGFAEQFILFNGIAITLGILFALYPLYDPLQEAREPGISRVELYASAFRFF